MSFLSEKTVFRIIIAVLILGTVYRLYPIVLGQPALSQAFMTEDGYLMLTIARNMAIGLGMSVSEGTIPSNGVQPLATFLFTVPYLLTGGDKVAGLAGVQLISAAISVAGIFSVRAFAREVLAPQDASKTWPWMVAALWFVAPLLLLHTMNGLETGLYTVMLTLTLVLFGRLLARGDRANFRDRMVLGAACGVTFLARNDGAFLVTAIFAVWFLHDVIAARRGFWRVVAMLIPPGLLSLAIAAPWLINNYVNFGSIVPISGTAQALSGGFARNADQLPAVLFEYVFPMLPVPVRMQFNPVFQVIAVALVLIIVGIFIFQAWRRGGVARYVVAAYLLFALALCGYYGFYFGAGWFLSRYLSPIAPLMITASVSVLIWAAGWLLPRRSMAVVCVLALAGLALCFALLGRYLIPGVKEQGHFQVVDWVTRNVPEETWVGAVQTGTVGYWHDRTINLDGKVNPDALQALLTEGHALNYILQSPVDYLADWAGIAAWTTTGNHGIAEFSSSFEVIVQDEARNLAVLKRR